MTCASQELDSYGKKTYDVHPVLCKSLSSDMLLALQAVCAHSNHPRWQVYTITEFIARAACAYMTLHSFKRVVYTSYMLILYIR